MMGDDVLEKKMKILKERINIELKGSITVESAFIVPMIFLVIVLIIHGVLYYHDKNILIGAAGEVATVAAGRARREELQEGEMLELFSGRIAGKLTFFNAPQVTIYQDGNKVTVEARASKQGMGVTVSQTAGIRKTEQKIRRFRILTP